MVTGDLFESEFLSEFEFRGTILNDGLVTCVGRVLRHRKRHRKRRKGIPGLG